MSGTVDQWTETDDVAMEVWRERQASDGTDGVSYARPEYPPLTPPQHSRVGIAIGLALCFVLTVAGFLLALTAPALSGGTVAGMALVAAGGAGCARIVRNVTRALLLSLPDGSQRDRAVRIARGVTS